MTFVGLDLHKRYITACALDCTGGVVGEVRRMPVSLGTLGDFLAVLTGPETTISRSSTGTQMVGGGSVRAWSSRGSAVSRVSASRAVRDHVSVARGMDGWRRGCGAVRARRGERHGKIRASLGVERKGLVRNCPQCRPGRGAPPERYSLKKLRALLGCRVFAAIPQQPDSPADSEVFRTRRVRSRTRIHMQSQRSRRLQFSSFPGAPALGRLLISTRSAGSGFARLAFLLHALPYGIKLYARCPNRNARDHRTPALAPLLD